MEKLDKHEIPLVIIVGPTASGKTRIAIDLAKKFNGEIICADSRTIYREIDIATAKPSSDEQNGVPHWGIDIVDIDQEFSVMDFKKYADEKIEEIVNRGHIPFLVGGTGLYVDAVMFDYKFGNKIDKSLRSELQQLSLEDLHKYCIDNKIDLPRNYKNKRHVIRNIENNGIKIQDSKTLKYKSLVVGITTEKKLHGYNITKRIEQQLENGVIEEAMRLSKKYGWNHESMKSNIYRIIKEYLDGNICNDQLVEKASVLDWRLAKRQITWLKRNRFVQWMEIDKANSYLIEQLALYNK